MQWDKVGGDDMDANAEKVSLPQFDLEAAHRTDTEHVATVGFNVVAARVTVERVDLFDAVIGNVATQTEDEMWILEIKDIQCRQADLVT